MFSVVPRRVASVQASDRAIQLSHPEADSGLPAGRHDPGQEAHRDHKPALQ